MLTSSAINKQSLTAVCQTPRNDETVKSAFIHLIIVIALLSVQMSESFAFAQMPCSDETAAEMEVGSHDMHTAHDMMKHSQSDDMNDCCQQDCCCPMAMFHVGLLSSQDFQPNPVLSVNCLERGRVLPSLSLFYIVLK